MAPRPEGGQTDGPSSFHDQAAFAECASDRRSDIALTHDHMFGDDLLTDVEGEAVVQPDTA